MVTMIILWLNLGNGHGHVFLKRLWWPAVCNEQQSPALKCHAIYHHLTCSSTYIQHAHLSDEPVCVKWVHCCPLWLLGRKHLLQLQRSLIVKHQWVIAALWPQGAVVSTLLHFGAFFSTMRWRSRHVRKLENLTQWASTGLCVLH